MATYLLTWNPKKWNWTTLDEDLATFRTKGLWVTSWSCGKRKAIFPEDRVFLIKLGSEKPRGLFASGYVTRGLRTARHFTDRSKTANYVDVEFDVLLDPRTDVLSREVLDRPPFDSMHWSTQASGIEIAPSISAPLEELWDKHVRGLGLAPIAIEYSNDAEVEVFVEGTRRKIHVNRLERSAAARAACINAKGVDCKCCGLNFSSMYGSIGDRFIHVHHQTMLADGGKRSTNPIEDLFPVCPNCHAMLHRTNPPMGIKQMRQIIRRSNTSPSDSK